MRTFSETQRHSVDTPGHWAITFADSLANACMAIPKAAWQQIVDGMHRLASNETDTDFGTSVGNLEIVDIAHRSCEYQRNASGYEWISHTQELLPQSPMEPIPEEMAMICFLSDFFTFSYNACPRSMLPTYR